MTAVAIDLFPTGVLLVILYDLHRNHTMDGKARWFRMILLMTLLVMCADIAAWALDGERFPGAWALLLIANKTYFAIGAFVAYTWALFSYYILYGAETFRRRWKRFALFTIPLLIFILIILVRTDWIIEITEDNQYQRGSGFFLQVLVSMGYVLLGCAQALIHGLREKVPAQRREDFHLAAFVLVPIAGGIIQILHMGIVLQWPLTVVALLLFYLNLRHDDVQKDQLTGLFNRRLLDEYLTQILKTSDPADEWYLLLIDFNRFKQINDTYGHAVGDEALQRTAAILQGVFSEGDAFVARYGGDEFAVVVKGGEGDMPSYLERLHAAVRQANEEARQPYEISLSCGGAAYGHGQYESLEALVAQADRNMYAQKKEYHSAVPT